MTETIEMKEVVIDGQTKYTIAFALTDENGEPLRDRAGNPRFTNLTADTPAELVTKIAKANLEVSRALNRSNQHIETLKKTPTPKRAAPNLETKPLTPDEQVQVGLDAQDPRKAAEAIKKVVESVVPVAQIKGEIERQGQDAERDRRVRVAREFFGRHPEYNTHANGALLGKWLNENGYEFSVDNIEIAFVALQDRLAPIHPPAPRNDPPPAPVIPDNAAPGNEPPNSGTPPALPRRAPTSGISNSQASGRPASATVLTRQQALEMLYKRPREYEAWMRDPVKNQILNQALAGR